MRKIRQLRATLSSVEPLAWNALRGVYLGFRPHHSLGSDSRIEHFAALAPEDSVGAALGLGQVLRILRAARIHVPRHPTTLAHCERETAALLERALGTPLRLEVRPRTRLRFVAWTEKGIESVENVSEVVEAPDAYYVSRQGGRLAARFPREEVVRQRLEAERWYEVLNIDRSQQ